MITKEFKTAFKLHRLLFVYLPKIVVEWDAEYKAISISKSYLSWAVWLLFMSDAFLIASGNFYVLYTHYFIQKRPHFHLTHAFIFVTGGFAVGIVCVVAIFLIRRIDEILMGFNSMQITNFKMMKSELTFK